MSHHCHSSLFSLGRVATSVLALLTSTVVGLGLSLSAPTVAHASSGVSLMPGAGQFVSVEGTLVASLTSGLLNSDNTTATSVTVGNTYHVSLASAGVPSDASAVALEFIVKAKYNGGLVSGASVTGTDTSLNWPAGITRYGFDTVEMDANRNVYIRTFANGQNSDMTTPTLNVRLHGYYTGTSSTSAGSTYVGLQPTLVYDSATNTNAAVGPVGNRPMPSDSHIQITSAPSVPNDGVPADGSASAVALQTIVTAPLCSGGFGVYPDGSTRADWDGAFLTGQDDENFDLVKLSSSGKVQVHLGSPTGTCPSGATVEVRVWVRGYFTAPTFSTPGASYVPVQEVALDTTTGAGHMLAPMNSACSTSSPIPAHGGCTVQVSGVGTIPSTGVTGVGAQVMAVGNNASGTLVLTSSSSGSLSASLDYSPTSSSGRYTNFEMTTYSDLSDGNLYIYNTGDVAIGAKILIHGYNTAPSAPGDPETAPTVGAGTSTATVSWSPSTTDGGAAITGYTVQALDSTTHVAATTTVSPQSTAATLTNLSPSTPYAFTVTAINDVGPGRAVDAPPDDASAPTATQPQPTSTVAGPAVAAGVVKTSDGQAAAGYDVRIYPADDPGAPVDSTTGAAQLPLLGTTSTSSDGSWSLTLPSPLPGDLQSVADDNDGVLNVKAVALGSIDGTSLPVAAESTIPVGIPSNGTYTEAAIQEQQLTPTVSRLYAVQPDNGAPADETTSGTAFRAALAGVTTTDSGFDLDHVDSTTESTTSSFSPMVVQGTDYSTATLTPDYAGAFAPTGSQTASTDPCAKIYDAGLVVKMTTQTVYTTVGEAHAWWNSKADFIYRNHAASDLSVGLSLGAKDLWSVDGSVHVGNSVGTFSGPEGQGPYWAHRIQIPILYQKVKELQCFAYRTIATHYAVYPLRYQVPSGGSTYKLGPDISGQYDGPAAYLNYYNVPGHKLRQLPGSVFGVTAGRTLTYGAAADVFGFSISSETEFGQDHEQVLHSLDSQKHTHWIYTNTPVSSFGTQPGTAYVFYSD